MTVTAFFDIDGVLANDEHRVEHALARRWLSYFAPATVAADPVWPQGREALEAAQAAGQTIAYLTGRREELRPVTQTWLDTHGFPEGVLHMRPLAVHVPLANLKANLLAALVEQDPTLSVVLHDDDPEVVRLVRERLGFDAAVHCTWHVKRKALVRAAIA